MLIEQYVFELEIAVHTVLGVDIGDSTQQLREDLLDLDFFHTAMFEEVVIQFVAYVAPLLLARDVCSIAQGRVWQTGTVFQHQPYQRLGDNHLIKTRNVWVEELAMMVDLARQVRIVLLGRLEHNLQCIPSDSCFVGNALSNSRLPSCL